MILPVSAGSGVDTIVRAAAPALTKELGGQAVVIENLPGAGGITGTAALVKAQPDGNTIAFVSNNHAVNPSVYKKMPYDSLADITPISGLGATPFVLVVNPTKMPAKNAKEMVALLKAKPGRTTTRRRATARSSISPARCSSTPPASTRGTFRTRASARCSPT